MFLEGREELLQHFCTGILLSVAIKSLKVTDLSTSMKNNNLHSQKRHRLDASCGFYRPDAICQQIVDHQAC